MNSEPSRRRYGLLGHAVAWCTWTSTKVLTTTPHNGHVERGVVRLPRCLGSASAAASQAARNSATTGATRDVYASCHDSYPVTTPSPAACTSFIRARYWACGRGGGNRPETYKRVSPASTESTQKPWQTGQRNLL